MRTDAAVPTARNFNHGRTLSSTQKRQPLASGRTHNANEKCNHAKIAAQMCKLGATDADLAGAFVVTTVTIWNWQSRYTLVVGKGLPDDKVECSLYQRAVVYSYSTEKIFHHQGLITRAEYVEHVPPDSGAAKLWLTNRRPEEWRDKNTTELTGKDARR